MNEHPTVDLTDPYGGVVQIDSEIAPLIQWLWNRGWDTINSCQDNFGYVWIEFVGTSAAEAFLEYIVEHGDKTLRSRARDPYNISPRDRSRLENECLAWHDAWLIGACADYDERTMTITISVRLPREHLGRVKTCCGLSKMSDDWFTVSTKS
jgi:hypothetical protein